MGEIDHLRAVKDVYGKVDIRVSTLPPNNVFVHVECADCEEGLIDYFSDLGVWKCDRCQMAIHPRQMAQVCDEMSKAIRAVKKMHQKGVLAWIRRILRLGR